MVYETLALICWLGWYAVSDLGFHLFDGSSCDYIGESQGAVDSIGW